MRALNQSVCRSVRPSGRTSSTTIDAGGAIRRTGPPGRTARKLRRMPSLALNHASSPEGLHAVPPTLEYSGVRTVFSPLRVNRTTLPRLSPEMGCSSNRIFEPSRDRRGDSIHVSVSWMTVPTGYSRRQRRSVWRNRVIASCWPSGDQSAPPMSRKISLGAPPPRVSNCCAKMSGKNKRQECSATESSVRSSSSCLLCGL